MLPMLGRGNNEVFKLIPKTTGTYRFVVRPTFGIDEDHTYTFFIEEAHTEVQVSFGAAAYDATSGTVTHRHRVPGPSAGPRGGDPHHPHRERQHRQRRPLRRAGHGHVLRDRDQQDLHRDHHRRRQYQQERHPGLRQVSPPGGHGRRHDHHPGHALSQHPSNIGGRRRDRRREHGLHVPGVRLPVHRLQHGRHPAEREDHLSPRDRLRRPQAGRQRHQDPPPSQ